MDRESMRHSLTVIGELARNLQAERLGNSAVGPDTVHILLQRIIDEAQWVCEEIMHSR